jgi:hypothetical protein
LLRGTLKQSLKIPPEFLSPFIAPNTYQTIKTWVETLAAVNAATTFLLSLVCDAYTVGLSYGEEADGGAARSDQRIR